ncbi:GlxA family transcriptional regulator [Pseudomonas typographi]|uniref:GlxA family transcriptional regulator n=1 Tax=Pseudomonas typographi TaxID=2715964 RepID=UPI0016885D1B|nr:GlxA family transcriptional regulator [Pseudomonas typographi]MBD1553877.1 GlxA family transcriptional regulator [Pseudomonas typographi]
MSHQIDMLAFAAVQVLDVTGPLQVFASANDLAQAAGRAAPYQLRLVCEGGGPVMTSAGMPLLAQPLPAPADACHTLLVAGGWGVYQAAAQPALVRWLRERAGHCQRIASVCTGAFLLAHAGLLDGRRAVTHWSRCEQLAKAFPGTRVEPARLYINDGPLWTSAGVTAGIDLALALVEEDLGHAAALEVARHLVVFLKRPGDQAQFSTTLALQQAGGRFDTLHAWMLEHLAADLSVGRLAEQAGMSERSFLRHYRAHTGHTPARAVELMRLEAACRLLAQGQGALKRIARQCGFASEETLRRCFIRHRGVPPQAWGERFRGNAAG